VFKMCYFSNIFPIIVIVPELFFLKKLDSCVRKLRSKPRLDELIHDSGYNRHSHDTFTDEESPCDSKRL